MPIKENLEIRFGFTKPYYRGNLENARFAENYREKYNWVTWPSGPVMPLIFKRPYSWEGMIGRRPYFSFGWEKDRKLCFEDGKYFTRICMARIGNEIKNGNKSLIKF